MSTTLSIELLGLYENVDIIGMKTIITRIKAAFQLVKNYNLNTENVTGLKYAYAAKWQTECSARTGAWERRSRHKAMRGGSEDVLRRHTENPSSAKNLYAARNEFPPSRISEPAVERL